METGHALPALKQTYTDVSALTYHQDGCEVVLFFGEEPGDRSCDLPGMGRPVRYLLLLRL